MKVKYVILGIGISGLAFAGSLNSNNYVVLEKESDVGGLCRAHKAREDRPKTQNPNLKVGDKANDMGLCESKVDLMSDYDVDLKQKVGTDD